jgi:phosphoserine phosphatase
MRAMVRLGLRMGADLGTIIGQVNAQLQQDLPSNRFVTAFLGVVDSIGHRLRYYSCGQAPLLHFHARNSEVEWLGASALPLGIVAGITIPEPPPMKLEPGDIVGVISDGFFEYADSTGRLFGTDRMADVISLNSTKSMADLIGAILAAIKNFAPAEGQKDDMTAVLICRRS